VTSAAELPGLLQKLLEDGASSWKKESLHPSTDLLGCLRRTCLELAEAEQRQPATIELTRRRLGTELHRWMQAALEEQGYQVENEIDLRDGMPGRWSGRADTLLTARSSGEVWLIDLKIVPSVQLYMADLNSDRRQPLSNKDNSWPSRDHIWQMSAYVWALREMGKQVDKAALLYWPVDTYYDRAGRKHAIEPRAVEIDPVPKDELWARMEGVDGQVAEWEKATKKTGEAINYDLPQHLEPEQKLIPKPSYKRVEKYELHQKLDWHCRYCPFFGVSCEPPHDDMRLGEFLFEDGEWVYHPEVAGIEPLVRP
jgi:hypothetical protein